jgi:hypothetical protein
LILEIETGVVGGEEDGVRAAAKLYTTPEDLLLHPRLRLGASPLRWGLGKPFKVSEQTYRLLSMILGSGTEFIQNSVFLGLGGLFISFNNGHQIFIFRSGTHNFNLLAGVFTR